MCTLLEALYNLLSYVSENLRKELPEELAEPIEKLMAALDNYFN